MPTTSPLPEMLADYLAVGYWTEFGFEPRNFETDEIDVNIADLSDQGQVLARAALQAWSTVANLHFREVTSSAQVSVADDGTGAMTTVGLLTDGAIGSAVVNVGQNWLFSYGSQIGSYSFRSYIHEIGHALGLGHAGPYNGSADYQADAKFQNDSWQMSVMSYFNQDQNDAVDATFAVPVTPMMGDILALQHLYGVPVGGPSAGDTTWGIGSTLGTYLDQVFEGTSAGLYDRAMTIFDEGGSDTLCLANDTRDQHVDLSGGAFSSVYGERGNLGIVPGTTIENYVAGCGDDLVVGNGAGNWIDLGAGRDRARGMDGDDVLVGGSGRDVLCGDAGNDRLDGGIGRDLLSGGRGRDTFVFGSGRDVILAFQNNVDTLVLDDALWGGVHLSERNVLDRYASTRGHDVLLDFGHGAVLRIKDVASVAQLYDDLSFLAR